ncbi:MAG TPA: SusC/RagA family TonB-linked outer membrane protein [Gemmatimonadales bacterium]|nr:SusC/RagA family TonB-linked outer membrane protein [Gemmatimonadales bacterium]
MAPALRRFFASLGALLLLPAAGLMAQQQAAVITGTVTSDNGRPLANATVSLTQLGLGGSTREDGHYTILVPANRVSGQQVTVTARAINYKPQTTTVTLAEGQITQDFSLAANPLQLGELVVTGEGTTSEVSKLGNVRSSVSGQEITHSQEPSVINALSAKAPNVVVTSSSGDPGSSAFIQIRGPRTYSGSTQPLFVVDGMPVDNTTYATFNFDALDGEGPITGGNTQSRLTDINPADIESVEILKGPSASSIYGASAGNGVILITTKHGHAGPTRYSLRSSFGTDNANNYMTLQRSFGQGTNSIAPAPGDCDRSGAAICFRSWGPQLAAGTPTFDHARDLFTTGFSSDQTLTISGGNDRTTFFISGNNLYQNGSVIGSNDVLRRTAVKLSGSHQASNAIKIGANLNYSKTDGRFIDRGNNTSGILLGSYRTPPEYNNFADTATTKVGATNPSSFIIQKPDPVLDFGSSRVFDNPVFDINNILDQSSNQRVFGNANIEASLASWLKLNETIGTDYYNDDRANALPINASSFPAGDIKSGNITNFTIDQVLTATATWKKSANLGGTFTIGQNVNANRQTLRGTTGRGFITTTPFNLQNTVTRDPIIDQQFKTRTVGYFGQATFDIANQLYLTGALRYDGSNTYSPDNRYAWFPKASMAWNFIKDRPTSTVSYAKIRASYGEAGVNPLPYELQTLVSPQAGFFFNGGVQGVGLNPTENGIGGVYTQSTKGADQLVPERSKEFETGFDVGLFGDKSDLSFTFYQAKTANVILPFPLPPSTGFQFQNANAGRIRNRGIEVNLNIRPVTKRDFAWDLGFQFARNRNDVLGLGENPPDFLELPGAFLVSQGLSVGLPYGSLRGSGLIRCGVSSSGVLPDFDAACQGQPKGALYIGADGFPILDPSPTIIGNPNADWTGSGRTSFRVKNLTLSALVDVRNGGDVWDGTRGALYSYGTHKDTEQRASCTDRNDPTTCTGNVHTFGQDFWFIGPTVGPGAGTPVSIGEGWYRNTGTTFAGDDGDFIEDGGFIRLREVALQLSLNQPWVRRSLGLSSIDLRVAGRNLLTSTKYRGLDPETNLGQAQQVRRGLDYFNTPQSRSFNFTVTLSR